MEDNTKLDIHCPHCLFHEKREAVILAAKALLKDGLPLHIRVARVTDAVLSLLAAEEGE
jgi:hypothetical protein